MAETVCAKCGKDIVAEVFHHANGVKLCSPCGHTWRDYIARVIREVHWPLWLHGVQQDV